MTEKQTAGTMDGGYETPLTDAAIDRLVNAIRADGGLGYYLMVIKADGSIFWLKSWRGRRIRSAPNRMMRV